MDTELVGVAISTHQRPTVLARALAGWAKFMPDILIVNHDLHGDGVAATKNAGIRALMGTPGCTHLFLADDDVWPVAPWAHLYVNDPEPHLMHCWGRRRLIADDGHYTTWSWPRGVLLYCHRTVIEQVGGMRTDFIHAGEHAEFSRRIHNAGFTKAPFQDLTQARHGIWHCEDYTRRTPSSLPADRYQPQATNQRQQLYDKYRHSTDYVDYHQ